MPDETNAAPKSTAEEFKDKSPQAILAATIVLLADLMHDKEQSKILKVLAPLVALVVVLSVKKGVELGVFLFKYIITKPPEQEKPLDVKLKSYIKENTRKLFWMRKRNPEYAELMQHTKQLRKRLRKYQLGLLDKLDVKIEGTISHALPPQAPPTQ